MDGGREDGDATIIIYGYVPNFALQVVAIILFTIAFCLHLYRLLRTRSWYFTPMVVGLAMEIGGYVFRTLSSRRNPYKVAYFVGQYFLIVVAPVLFSASIYTIVSMMIRRYGRQYSPLPPKFILWFFIGADVFCTVMQIVGAALVGVAYSNMRDPTIYNHILLAGLAAQVFTFALFIITAGIILYRLRGVRKPKMALWALGGASLMIYLRTCFRLAETAEGLLQNLSSHEFYFGCLEFAPIVIAVFLLAYWHPGVWLSSNRKNPASQDKV